MWKKRGFFVILILQFLLNCLVCSSGVISYDQTPSGYGSVGRLVKKEERFPVVSTEFGAVSAVDVGDGTGRHNFHLQFITLEPNALFLPVLLHSQMVFYVQTGSGRLSWADPDKGELKTVELQRGDVYRLKSGSLFYVHSGLQSDRPRLRIIAIFVEEDELEFQEPFVGPYSSINDLIRGFDTRVLQSAFQVPQDVIEELTSATDTPAIVHADTQEKKKRFWEKDIQFIETLLGLRNYNREATLNKKKHSKSKAFNFFKGDPDFHNCNGWSKVVTKHDLDALHGSHIGVFMVNLTKGAMMGPHWNPMATEVSIVLEGEGMVGIVCPSTLTDKECKNSRFRVEEGDVFTVPRFHPMAQMSFNNGSFVFMGFSTTTKKNHPQFLAGKASVLRTLDRFVLGASFNVSNSTIDQLLAAQEESVILECTSCAEEEEVLMEKEIEEQRQEEEERRREEEERRRQEEEEKKREEEEQKRKEEERRRREEEEERRRQEEEETKKREEEEEKRREEEEERKRHEEEERKKREEEEEKRREEEEERRRREEEERKRKEEEERRKQEEEQRQEEEEARRREEQRREEKEEEEEQRRRQAEEEEEQRKQEEASQREQEEEARRREEEQRRQEEEEAARRQREQEEEWRREQEEQRRAEEERRRRREKERGRGEESEEEAARREEQERIEWERRQEEEAERRRREHKHEPEPEFEWELVKMEDQSTEDGNLGHVGTTRRRSLNA